LKVSTLNSNPPRRRAKSDAAVTPWAPLGVRVGESWVVTKVHERSRARKQSNTVHRTEQQGVEFGRDTQAYENRAAVKGP